MDFTREKGTALAWLLLFVLLAGGALYERVFKQTDAVVALK